MSKCRENQIKNPLTRRCVNIEGAICVKLVKKFQNKVIQLDREDIDKLIAFKKLAPRELNHTSHDVPEYTKTTPEPIKNIHVSNQTKNLVSNWVNNWRKARNKKTLTKYCSSLSSKDLHQPIVSVNVETQYPLERIVLPLIFNPKELDRPISWMNILMPGIKLAYNNYNFSDVIAKNVNSSESISFLSSQVDWSWFIKMSQYIQNLPKESIYNLKGYTDYGDIIANNYLRGTLQKKKFMEDLKKYIYFDQYYPLFFEIIHLIENANETNLLFWVKKKKTILHQIVLLQSMIKTGQPLSLIYYKIFELIEKFDYESFWLNVIAKYVKSLQKIFDNVPPVEKNTVVYRGITRDYIMKGEKGNVYRTNCFVSTSFDLQAALRFTNVTCCFQRITLLPGSRVLLMAGVSKYHHEMEILLNPNTIFYITKNNEKISKYFIDRPLCYQDNDENLISVTDMIVIKT